MSVGSFSREWFNSLLMGFILGAVLVGALGFLVGLFFFSRGSKGAVAMSLGGAILGGLVGAFVGGVVSLGSPAPGKEPTETPQPEVDISLERRLRK